MTDLAAIAPQAACPAAFALVADLYSAVLSGRTANTLRAYQGDIQDFARYLGSASPAAALDTLTGFSPAIANACALSYRAHLADRGLAPATIARRLAALRSACKVARMLGRIGWEIEVESPSAESYRDTSGPGRDGWTAMLALAKARATTKAGKRDLAIVRLLHDTALRRCEAVELDVSDLDLRRATISVRGKGHTSTAPITLPGPTKAALADWLCIRGDDPGPLFNPLDKDGGYGRLSGESVRRIVRDLGRAADLSRPVAPHGLRHQAITHALDRTGGDVRAVRKFSRHAKLDTLVIYDDNRSDLAGGVAALVADE